jgi:hypothetical protein
VPTIRAFSGVMRADPSLQRFRDYRWGNIDRDSPDDAPPRLP